MRTKRKARSRIMAAVHEGASDLYNAGFIDKRRMAEFDALCLDPVPEFTSTRVKSLRHRHNLSQAVLAAVLNTSISTVRQWEIGDKRPSGPSAKLLDLLERKGLDALL